MAANKKTAIYTLLSEDVEEFIDQSQFLEDSPKTKKTLKRATSNETFEEDDMSRLIVQYQASAKKKRAETSSDANPESLKKILDLVGNQLQARKQCNANLFKRLSVITKQVEADYNAMKSNEQILEYFTRTYMKCIQQATSAYKQKLEALKEIQASFKEEFAEMESDHKIETEKLVYELEYDFEKLQDKLVAETKRSGWELLSRSIFHAMQNDFLISE